ncbi:MAG: F0F1 ATP synthase subunit gamma [Burkholderiaceae bacterium]|nr:F0F1 ATP synthase subunit gamma [Burkholderiaceae bacterium]
MSEGVERLRRQLDSVEDLGTLVHTMKALAQVSIHQSERAVRAVHLYLRTVRLGAFALLRDSAIPAPPDMRADAPRGLIVLGSDHGMCGRFNDDAAEQAAASIDAARRDGASLRLGVVGARVAAHLEAHDAHPETRIPAPGSTAGITATVQRLLGVVDAWRDAGIEHVALVHNRSVGAMRYEPVVRSTTPVDLRRIADIGGPWPSRRLPIHKMPREALLAAIVRQYVFAALFEACAESLAAEHGARLAAMQAAGESLDERREELGTKYRRRRQEAITAELLDVVGGFAVLTQGVPDPERDRFRA